MQDQSFDHTAHVRDEVSALFYSRGTTTRLVHIFSSPLTTSGSLFFRFLDDARGNSLDAAEAMAKFYNFKPPCPSMEPKAAAVVGAFCGADPAPFVGVAIDARRIFPWHKGSAADHERALAIMKTTKAKHAEAAAQERALYEAKKAREATRQAEHALEREREHEALQQKIREAREVRKVVQQFGLTSRGIAYRHLSNANLSASSCSSSSSQGGIRHEAPSPPPFSGTRSNLCSNITSLLPEVCPRCALGCLVIHFEKFFGCAWLNSK